MIFASLVVEQEPVHWQDLPGQLELGVQNAGGFAAVALVIYCVYLFFQGPSVARLPWSWWQRLLLRLGIIGMVVGYGAFAALKLPELLGKLVASAEGQPVAATSFGSPAWPSFALTFGGACALFVLALPFLSDLPLWRGRRIWALARLSFKEAIRRRVLWVFSALLLVFLFGNWFIDYKPENQVRNYVRLTYWAMSPLLLVTAGLVAAFSIPADVRNQTMHTIVTKPVERFEIVLGRFLGYMILMTLVLAVMTSISLLYLFREIDPDAKKESMHARVPLYGRLGFASREQDFKGSDVGREWDYRKYIAGGSRSSQRAIWTYTDLPRELASRPDGSVRCEFSFDIFRTLKGEEGKGVRVSFQFVTRQAARPKTTGGWEVDPKRKAEFDQEYQQEMRKPDANPEQISRLLAEKHGLYEVLSKEIADYHTEFISLPAALFQNALATEHKPEASAKSGASASALSGKTGPSSVPTGGEDPQLIVLVKCEDGGQYLGVARHDFYLLAADGDFKWNFFKGAAGLWLRLCLVTGLAVALSTYLSGVISAMTTFFLYAGGGFKDFVQSLAEGKNIGGGPAESFRRLINRESLVTQLEQTPAGRLAQGTDMVYRWILSRVLDILPDVNRLDWTDYVSEGFNIGTIDMALLHVLLVAIYLLPWMLLAYYMMKSREIAS
jgi:hypothetical protein